MNQVPHTADDSQRTLEQTTAPRTVSSVGLSSESVAERDSYLQLGQLLDRAAGEFDERAFLRKLQAGQPIVVNVATTSRVEKRKRSPWLWGVAVAVVAVVAAGVVGRMFTGGRSEIVKQVAPAPERQPSAAPAVQPSPTVAQKSVPPKVVAPAPVIPRATIEAAAEVATAPWSDPLDGQIDDIREQVRDAHRTTYVDAPLQLISERLRELSEDLESGEL